MKNVAVYMRVSTRRQDTASQEPDLKRWAEAAGGEVKWYRDAFTGKTMDRPGWSKLEKAIRAGQVDRVVVWRLDRLGRTAKELTALFADLIERGVGLVSLRDGIDLGTAAGRLMANVLASVAQFETEVRGERVMAGHAAARRKGKRWGGSKKGRAMKTRATPEQVDVIRRMKAEGKPVAAIARATGLARMSVYRYLAELEATSTAAAA